VSKRFFLDANVLFSAAWQDGKARALFPLAKKTGAALQSSPHAINEARKNLEAKRPETLRRFSELLAQIEVVPEPPPALVSEALKLGLPLKDAPILAAAWQAGAHALVTGDRKHFGALLGKTAKGTKILSPAEAFQKLLNEARKR